MIFSLEVLSARHGDCLIVHYGSTGAARLIVLDGGPSGVYGGSLRPRLETLRKSRTPGEELPIELLMVSHIDDDHIRGVLDLIGDLAERTDDEQPIPYRVRRLWLNSFDDIIGNQAVEAFGAVSAEPLKFAPAGLRVQPESVAVAASVNQGRELRDQSRKLAIPLNLPFSGLVMAGAAEEPEIDLGEGLSLRVVAPNRDRLEALQREWDAVVKSAGDQQEAAARAAAYLDRSVLNLSSIVVLARAGDLSMLLTGDARGDDILAGLSAEGLLTSDAIHVDVLKLPHHGSDRNVETDFFRAVTADHYVVSADGTHGNPEVATLQMILEARGMDAFQVHLTNSEPRLIDFFDQAAAAGSGARARFRAPGAASLRIDLADPIDD